MSGKKIIIPVEYVVLENIKIKPSIVFKTIFFNFKLLLYEFHVVYCKCFF